MRYVIDVDIEPGEKPKWTARVRPATFYKRLGEGDGFDLTQALLNAGSAVLADARLRPDLWGVVK